MKFEVLRFSSQKDSTSGALFNISNGKRTFMCYTLEDEQRDVKVYGETRVPSGEYKLSLRTEGGFHNSYLSRYGPDFHKGMIEVLDIPQFTYVLWHCGNTDEDTAGCLLLGNSQTSNLAKADGFIGSSRDAYGLVYPIVLSAILEEGAMVVYNDYDGDMKSVEDVNVIDKLSEISGEIQMLGAKIDKRKIF